MSRNRDMLRHVASALVGLEEPVVFVGGAVIELLVTDAAAPAPRATDDVDVVVQVGSFAAYARLGDRLRDRGFREDSREGAPICRWILGEVTVDVMPAPLDLLGFSNPWYPTALALASDHELGGHLSIRVASGPVLLATKLEAFASGHRGDIRESSDIEDIIALVDGRESLAAEVRAAPVELRGYLADRIGALLDLPGFDEVVSGHLPGGLGQPGASAGRSGQASANRRTGMIACTDTTLRAKRRARGLGGRSGMPISRPGRLRPPGPPKGKRKKDQETRCTSSRGPGATRAQEDVAARRIDPGS